MRKTTKYATPVLVTGLIFGFSSLSPSAASVTTVEEGDTLWSIAQEHEDVTTDDLVTFNHGLNPNTIPVGTEISLEGVGNDNGESNQEAVTHTVQPGDTLWSITNAYDGMTIDDLYELNNGLDPHELQVGSELTVAGNPESSSHETHTVQPGNTFSTIAMAYDGVTVEDLREANPGVDEYSLQIGTNILIPIE